MKTTSGWMAAAICGVLTTMTARAAGPTATVVEQVPAATRTPLYVGNRAPLRTSPMIKLPISAIKPDGWLKNMLQLSAAGNDRASAGGLALVQVRGQRLDRQGPRRGKNGWEEVPYWLKGFGDLGYVLGDERIIKENDRWLDAIFAAQAADGVVRAGRAQDGQRRQARPVAAHADPERDASPTTSTPRRRGTRMPA